MKRLLIIFLLLFSANVYAAPPTRGTVYTSGTTISSNDVNANENALYNYLIAGVDTYAAGSIDNGAINANASISASKLNLANIAQNISNTGTLTNIGSFNLTGTLTTVGLGSFSGGLNSTKIGQIVPSSGDFTTLTASGTTTLSGAFKLGTTNQGDILYDNGTSFTRLTPGTSGQFLKTQGAGANPVWASQGLTLTSATSFTTATNSGDITISPTKYYLVVVKYGTLSAADNVAIRFNNDTGATYNYVSRGFDTGATASNIQATGATSIRTTADLAIAPAAVTTDNFMTFYIYPQILGNRFVFVKGNAVGFLNSTSAGLMNDFMGWWNNAAAVSSFRVFTVGGQTMTGVVNLYELSQ